MKTKKIFFTCAAMLVLMWVTSCSGGSGGSKGSMFGKIPSLYEERLVEFAKEVKNAQADNDMEKALTLLKELQEKMDEAAEKAQPLADQMVGNTISYALSDSLPYQVVSDIKVEKVRLPDLGIMKGGDKPVRLDVKFDVVITQEVERSFRVYYFIMDNDTPIGTGMTSGYGKKAVGDTLHIEETVVAPDAPAKYQEKCNSLKFVTENAYKNGRTAIDQQLKQWDEEMKKKLGLE